MARRRSVRGLTITSICAALGVLAAAAALVPAASPAREARPASELAPPPEVLSLFPTMAPVTEGKKVKIKGNNFTGATEVHFGPDAASFTVEKATEIVAVAPVQAGIVDVTVTTPSGTSAITPEDRFEYVGHPPAVSGIAPAKAAAAGGTTVTVHGENFIGASQVLFGEDEAIEISVLSSTAINAVVPGESVGRVSVHVVTPYGTSAEEYCAKNKGCSVRDHFKFDDPTVISVSPAHGPAAGGETVTVTGTGFAPGTTETSFALGSAPSPSVDCTSPTRCQVLTPAHKAGAAQVLVKVRGSQSSKSSAPIYTYE